MQRVDRILAVIDSTVDAEASAAKVSRLAGLAGATVELFRCDGPGHGDDTPHESILRRIAACDPDLVIRDAGRHSPLQRTLFSGTDWGLVRSCPAPLLLSRRPSWPERPRILAALDPGHHGDKTAALDHDILDAAQVMARYLGGEVEAVHVFFPAALLAATSSLGGIALAPDLGGTGLVEAECDRMTLAMRALARAHGLAPEAARVVQGSPVERLPGLVRERGIDLVVMGAVSRSRLHEVLVGSTAQQVLDELPCDVLVIKPPDFRERLPF